MKIFFINRYIVKKYILKHNINHITNHSNSPIIYDHKFYIIIFL